MPTLTWLGQAGFLAEGAGRRCLFDPFLSDGPERLVAPPVEVEALPELAAVLVSHQHDDHFDPEALRRLVGVQPDVRVIVPESVGGQLEGSAAAACLERRPGEGVSAGGLRVRVVPALHGVEISDAYRFGPFQGYVVELDGVRIYHAGDTLAWDGLAATLRELRVDVALLPVNGRDAEREAAGIVGNMDHREAVALAAQAGCRVLVPMHYGMFAANTVDPALAVEEARSTQPRLDVRLPVLGAAFEV